MAAVVLFSSLAMARGGGVTSTFKNGWHNGNAVYYVVLKNHNNYRVHCKFGASNGAFYKFYLNAYDRSRRIRVNDRNAQYRYRCR